VVVSFVHLLASRTQPSICDFVINVLMHVLWTCFLSRSMHVLMDLLSNMCLCMLYMHVCCAICCTHMVLCNGSGG
jgi:hypothetical protein